MSEDGYEDGEIEIIADDNGLRVKIHGEEREASVHEILSSLTDEQRMDLFREFCRSCGSTDPRCQCWNDE